MASTDPKQAPQRKKLGGAAEQSLLSEEVVQKYLKLLQDYQNVVFAALVVVLLAGGLTVYLRQKSAENEDRAWAAYSKASATSTKVEDLEKDLNEFEGTGAHPLLGMALAAKLYEKGEKADLEKAQRVLSQIESEVRGNALLSDLVRHQLAGIQKELADPNLWSGTAPVGSK